MQDKEEVEVVPRDVAARELQAEIYDKRRSARRHTLWASLGVSPAGVLPMLGLGWDFGIAAVVSVSVAVSGIEAWRAVQAWADVREAEESLRQLPPATSDPST